MRAVVGLVAVAALALAAGCGVEPSGEADRIADDAVPYGLLDASADRVVPQPSGRLVTLCLLDGDMLVPVQRRLEPPVSLMNVVESLTVVSAEEAARGLSTSIDAEEEIASVVRRAGVAVIDLADDASLRLTVDPLATVAQLVCSLTEQPGIGLVQLTLAGTPIEVPRADGSLTLAPVSADDYLPLYAPE